MNLRHPFEQLIADKLRKLPAPNPDASWQQMKRLLDNDEDTKAGGKRPPGGRGWWLPGAMAVVVAASLWLYVDKKTTTDRPLAKNTTAVPATAYHSDKTGNSSTKKTNHSGNNQTSAIEKNITLSPTTTTSKDKSAIDEIATNNKTTTNNAVRPTLSLATAERPIDNRTVNQPAAGRANTAGHWSSAVDKNIAGHSLPVLDSRNNSIAPGKPGHTPYEEPAFTASRQAAGRKHHTPDAGIEDGEPAGDGTAQTDNAVSFRKAGDHQSDGKRKNDAAANSYLILGGETAKPPLKETIPTTGWKVFGQTNLPVANALLAVGDSIKSSPNSLPFNNETRKEVTKAQRDKAIADQTKKDKGFHLNLSNVFKPFSLHMDAEPRWAAGIALNSSVPLNAQRRFNYNMNAKSGALSDYIPSVYLQFHLNDYVYAQTEINFISPQYTPQLLVYQQSGLLPQPGPSQQKSIYIQKLYYFNLPLSLHYSPVNNLYFSAGLQFSSFQSGLATIQEKQYTTQGGVDHPTSVSSTVLKFKDDSIAAKLSPNEWRWQAGADYYWNRFTIGVRYNRAFNRLSNVNLSASLPATSMRNESMIFFMRYNLFESRKKGTVNEQN